jgi:hypothetical protein
MASLFAALRENHPPSTVHLSGADDDAFPASPSVPRAQCFMLFFRSFVAVVQIGKVGEIEVPEGTSLISASR